MTARPKPNPDSPIDPSEQGILSEKSRPDSEQVELTPRLVIWGLAVTLIGVLIGVLMSTATLFR